MSRSASLPAGVKPIWIGCVGSEDGVCDFDEVVELVELEYDEFELVL